MNSISVDASRQWSLLSTHGQVYAAIAANPEVRVRDIAETVGVTERTVAQILNDLEDAGHLERTRTGRRNRYDLTVARKVRPMATAITLGQLVALLTEAIDQQPFT